jgi:hypothetical protein
LSHIKATKNFAQRGLGVLAGFAEGLKHKYHHTEV